MTTRVRRARSSSDSSSENGSGGRSGSVGGPPPPSRGGASSSTSARTVTWYRYRAMAPRKVGGRPWGSRIVTTRASDAAEAVASSPSRDGRRETRSSGVTTGIAGERARRPPGARVSAPARFAGAGTAPTPGRGARRRATRGPRRGAARRARRRARATGDAHAGVRAGDAVDVHELGVQETAGGAVAVDPASRARIARGGRRGADRRAVPRALVVVVMPSHHPDKYLRPRRDFDTTQHAPPDASFSPRASVAAAGVRAPPTSRCAASAARRSLRTPPPPPDRRRRVGGRGGRPAPPRPRVRRPIPPPRARCPSVVPALGLPPAPRPRRGSPFSHFDVLGELGDGSFSEVLRARRRATGEVFALKVMPKRQILRHDAKARSAARRARRADLCADVPGSSGPLHVPGRRRAVHGPGRDGKRRALRPDPTEAGARRRGRRETLGPLARGDALPRELVDVLRAAHARGVVHRDVKPENVLINRRGHVELVDFGSCLILPESRSRNEEEGEEGGALPADGEDEPCCSSDAKEIRRRKAALAFVGTCDYVPPEVLGEPGGDEKGLADDLSRPAPSPFALDHWALGCVAFQALCGKPPFRRANEFLTYAAVQGGDAPRGPRISWTGKRGRRRRRRRRFA